MEIGTRIRNLRRERNMTLETLAKAVGTSKQTIHRYENGVITNIPSEKIEAIADALEVTPAVIMGWCDTPSVSDNSMHGSFLLPPFDLYITVADDSMSDAGIFGGDTVFIRNDREPVSGDIVAVATAHGVILRRVYFCHDNGEIVLNAENKHIAPLVFSGAEAQTLHFLGRAVYLLSKIR